MTTPRQEALRRWKREGRCTSCGGERERYEDGGFCARCADILVARYFDRLGESAADCRRRLRQR